jgi:hypothetical protein
VRRLATAASQRITPETTAYVRAIFCTPETGDGLTFSPLPRPINAGFACPHCALRWDMKANKRSPCAKIQHAALSKSAPGDRQVGVTAM